MALFLAHNNAALLASLHEAALAVHDSVTEISIGGSPGQPAI